MKIKKALRSICSFALAVVCCVATLSPVPARAAYTAEKSIDFSVATDADLFSTTYGGYSIADGAFKANTAWANTYLTDTISLASNKVISFDFCLADDNATDHQFNVALTNVEGGSFTGGLAWHFYYSGQHSVELLTLNTAFGNTYDGWKADTVVDYFDGQVHTMTITITDKVASFKIDGNDVLKSEAVGLDAPYLVFQATSTEYSIDNVKIESEIPEYRTLDVDFDVAEDANVFTTNYGGYSVSEGVYKANTAWANTYLNGQIPLDKNKEISFDFCLTDDNAADHQFNVGLTNVTGSAFTGGLSWHFYYSGNHSVELVTLNTAFGNTYDGWKADTVEDYFDGQTHTMTITIIDKVASFKIDGNDVLKSEAVGLDAPTLVFQATSTDYSIDNVKIKEIEEPLTPPGPTVLEYSEQDIDFDVTEDGDVFATTNGGWAVADGVYKATSAWATTYLNCLVPLNEDKEISFEFCLKNNGDANHQFNFALVDIDGETVTTDFAGHFYNHAQHGELFTLNRDFSSPTGNGWLGDNTDNYNDDQAHTMHIQVQDGKATIYIDEDVIFEDVTVNMTEAFFMLQATSVDTYVDDFKVSDTLTTIENSNDDENGGGNAGGNGGTGGSVSGQTYREMTLNFSQESDGDVFATNNGGWVVTNGVYKPSIAWATTYFDFKIPLNENKEISFDFCLQNNGDKNHQFNIGFVDVNGNVVSKGFAGHFFNHAQHGELFTLNRDFGNPVGEGWIADNTDNFNDGKVHHMLIQIQGGKVKFCIDQKIIFSDVELKTSSAYFILQATSTDTYIDNMKLSNTLTDTSKYSVSAQSAVTTAPTAGAMGTGSYKYKEMEFDFSKASDGDAFSTNFNGWSVVDGVYKPNSEWATTYPNCLIPLNEDKEITFDFCMKDVESKTRQFNMGFVTPNGETFNTFLAAHFYQHAQYGELFTLNRDFGNPIGEGWIADNTDHFNDGEMHTMMIRVKDGMVAFYIDGKEIFKEIPLNAEAAYFIMQFTSADSYIDNFRISDTLTYIPDYPTNAPDPEGDETTDGVTEDSLKETEGKVVWGLKEILMLAGAVVVIGGGAAGAVVLKKKRKGKINE